MDMINYFHVFICCNKGIFCGEKSYKNVQEKVNEAYCGVAGLCDRAVTEPEP